MRLGRRHALIEPGANLIRAQTIRHETGRQFGQVRRQTDACDVLRGTNRGVHRCAIPQARREHDALGAVFDPRVAARRVHMRRKRRDIRRLRRRRRILRGRILRGRRIDGIDWRINRRIRRRLGLAIDQGTNLLGHRREPRDERLGACVRRDPNRFLDRVAESQFDGLRGRQPGLGVHQLAHLVLGLPAALGVRRQHVRARAAEQIRQPAQFTLVARRERMRVVDHQHRVGWHHDLAAPHQQQRCGRRRDAVDAPRRLAGVAPQQVVDRERIEHVAAHRVDRDDDRCRCRADLVQPRRELLGVRAPETDVAVDPDLNVVAAGRVRLRADVPPLLFAFHSSSPFELLPVSSTGISVS